MATGTSSCKVTSDNIFEVARWLSQPDCVKLAVPLKFDEQYIMKLADTPFNSVVAFQLLLDWKAARTTKATQEELYGALKKIGRSDLARKIKPPSEDDRHIANATSNLADRPEEVSRAVPNVDVTDKRHSKILQKHRLSLLDMDTEDHVQDYLHQEEVINRAELEEISQQSTPCARADTLLKILSSKDQLAFAKVVEALCLADSNINKDLAELLQKYAREEWLLEDVYTAAPAFSPGQSGPDDFVASSVAMDPRHSQILKVHRMAILNIDINDSVADILVQKGIITEGEQDEIFRQRTSKDQTRKLLKILPRKGRQAFGKFVYALHHSDYRCLAMKLEHAASNAGCPVDTETAANVNAAPASSLNQTPAYDGRGAWPVFVHTAKDVELISPPITVTVHREGSSGLPDKVDQTDHARIYDMSHYPHGLALIINNTKFTCGLQDRYGSDVDARELKEVFELLGFSTHIVTNATGAEIRAHLDSLAVHNHTEYDAVIVAVLSHGTEGKIYGVDGDLVPIAEITSYYRGDKATTLLEKPKIFFLQACQGDEFDAGVALMDSSLCVDHGDAASPAGEYEDAALSFHSHQIPDDETDSHLGTLPVEADMVIAYATVPGYVSWRNSEKGSWFIQALVKVLREDSRDEHLMDMLVRVNDLVASEFQSKNRNKQIPTPVTRLRKKLYMRPP